MGRESKDIPPGVNPIKIKDIPQGMRVKTMANPINLATGKEYTMAELIAKVQELESAQKQNVFIRVSENKGSICLYGLQQRPVSLYPSQWERLIAPETIELVKGFIRNPDVLKLTPVKGESTEAEKTKATLRKASVAKLNGAPIVSHPTKESIAKYGQDAA
jgi:hypothetical protein